MQFLAQEVTQLFRIVDVLLIASGILSVRGNQMMWAAYIWDFFF